MKIYIDDQERPDLAEAPDSGAVLAGVKTHLLEKGRVIMEIQVDGVPMDEKAFVNITGNPEARFTSGSVRSLVCESLDEAVNYIPRLTGGMEKIASAFETGEISRGQSTLASAAEGLDWLISVFQQCSTLLAVDLETEAAGLNALQKSLVAGINDLASLHEDKKYSEMASCIRGSLIPEIDRFSLYIRHLRELCGSTQ
ncbi:MAG: hypothetical protein LBR61_04770 [Synergistaceae bacterium]|nr:hypothetical protein [Synergistaceae bacterium]